MTLSDVPRLSRREWLKLSAAGALTLPASGWLSTLAARAAEQSAGGKPKHKSCILLFMTGGASHIDTFDPKPENTTSAFQAIATAVPGIQVSAHLPKMAAQMKDCALLRGMSTTEGLSMPFWGQDYGGHAVTYLLTNPFNNALAFRDAAGKLTAQLTHHFTRNHPVKEYGLQVSLGSGSPVEPARRYRRWLMDRGEFASMREKIRRTPDAAS